MSDVNSVVTKLARQKMCKARAGVGTLPAVVGFAFGAGGVNEGGQVIVPSDEQNTLNTEIARKAYSSKELLTGDTTCRYTCLLEKSELVGERISEVALYDSDGDLVAIKNFLPKGKDADIELTFTIDDIF
jgi:hypothetical protein